MKIHAVFTTRHDGDMRQKKTPDTIYAEQIHGTRVAVVSAGDAGHTIEGVDGLVSKDSVRLAVHVADCVPVLAWEESSGVIGAAHAGWRGTAGNIAGNLIWAMRALGADPKKIHVSVGPHIGMCCYDVSVKRAKIFLKKFGSDKVASFFENAWHLDIGYANYLELADAGIAKEHIDAPVTCTSCQVGRYFSYRKDTKETFGEQMGTIWIETK